YPTPNVPASESERTAASEQARSANRPKHLLKATRSQRFSAGSELAVEESHQQPVKFPMEGGAIKVRRILANPRHRFGRCLATRRKKPKVAGLWYGVRFRRCRQSIADNVAVPWIRRLLVLFGPPELHWHLNVAQAASREDTTERWCR